MDMSLNEIINRQNAEAGFSLMDRKKNKPEIDKDKLDAELDMMMSGGGNAEDSNKNYRPALSSSKFDRYREKKSDSEDDDENEKSTHNSSINFAKEIEKIKHPMSQRWQMGGNYGTNRGRIQKNYRTENVTRGNFTYKLRNDSGIAGIVRNRRPPRVVYNAAGSHGFRKIVLPPESQRPIQVDVNLSDFTFNPYAQNLVQHPMAFQQPPAFPQGTAQLNMMLDVNDLPSFLAAKKEYEKTAFNNNGGY